MNEMTFDRNYRVGKHQEVEGEKTTAAKSTMTPKECCEVVRSGQFKFFSQGIFQRFCDLIEGRNGAGADQKKTTQNKAESDSKGYQIKNLELRESELYQNVIF